MTSPTDPFRFDDRNGHYGSGQADLAPLSPLAASPREDNTPRPLDPMGASPGDGQTADAGPTRSPSADRVEARIDARSDTQISSSAEPFPVAAQSGSDAAIQTTIAVEPREPPARDEAAPSQTVLLQTRTDMRAEGDVRADTETAPVLSGGTPVSLLPSVPGAAESAGAFADMAARMDQIMAEMTALMEGLSPPSRADEDADGVLPDPLAEAQDRLDDLFGSLADRLGGAAPDPADEPDVFEAARDRLDDLAGNFGSRDGDASRDLADPLSDAAARLNDLKAGLAGGDRTDPAAPMSNAAETSLLARLFDGDAAPDEASPAEARLADLLDEMDAPAFTLPVPDGDPGRWDDLPDFG